MRKWIAMAMIVAVSAAYADDVDRPTNPDALDRYWKALEKLDAGDRAGALEDLRIGYEAQPWPRFQYLIGKVAFEGKDCTTARESIKKFIELAPTHPDRKNADEIVAKCDEEDRKRQEEADRAARQRIIDAEKAAEAVRAREPKRRVVHIPWYRDPLGDALVGAGAVGLGVGLGFYLSSRSAVDDAEAASSLPAHRSALDRAKRRRLTSQIATGVGGALVLGGLVRYALRVDHYEVLVTPTTDGGATVGVASWF